MHHNGYDDGYYHDGRVPAKDEGKPYSFKKRGWDTGTAPKVCENCDFLPKDNKQRILVEYPVWKVLMALCTEVKVEWQALLKGRIEDGVVHINGYYIPKQEVGHAHVKNLDVIDDEFITAHTIVAGVHSHGTMNCFFSNTDHEDTNMSLIRHNIVVNNKGEYKACSRMDLPCGLVKFIDAEVMTVGEPDVVIEGLENIQEKHYKTDVWRPKTNEADQSGPDAMRWCPVCDRTPEEDDGHICKCVTQEKRAFLPEFTKDNYFQEYDGGRTWVLKPSLEIKYKHK